MNGPDIAALLQALAALPPAPIVVGARAIAASDENALLRPEANSITTQIPAARRASGAARLVARELMAHVHVPSGPVPKGPAGAPLWPAGLIGSFAHDQHTAVAALARTSDIAALGIDIEAASPLPADMLAMVMTPNERLRADGGELRGRILFAAKEAVYKAIYPLDGLQLDYQDIEIDLAGRNAVTRNNRRLELRVCAAPMIAALAWIDAAPSARQE